MLMEKGFHEDWRGSVGGGGGRQAWGLKTNI